MAMGGKPRPSGTEIRFDVHWVAERLLRYFAALERHLPPEERLIPPPPPPPEEPQEYLTNAEAARLAGLAPGTLEAWRRRAGGPPFIRLGRRVIYKRSDVVEWLDGKRRGGG